MRIGFSSIYSWRPHTEHLYYLAGLVEEAGHQVAFLTCDADLPACYNRELRPARNATLDCIKCRVGGIRSYAREGVTSIGQWAVGVAPETPAAREWAASSASTLGRFESDQDFATREFADLVDRLAPAVRTTYLAARRWIAQERLDAVCVFNGRMDATRAILEACRDAGIRCLTVERTWFGDGLQILPDENCLGLRSVDRMMAQWRDQPLERDQALRAAAHVASRFLRLNAKEWRAYNTAAEVTPWPTGKATRRLLLVPGSRNEVWGHTDWDAGWPDRTVAFDAIIDHLGLDPTGVVLRCHPNWGERIGEKTGAMAERHYTDWARRRGVHVIASTDKASTLGLIEQADAVVVCGGSAALEAGILGKQVIAATPSVYQQAGFQSSVYSPSALQHLKFLPDLDPGHRASEARRIARQTLRFCYTMVYRIPQFVAQVKCVTTTEYTYHQGADTARLMRLLRSGELEADDSRAASDRSAEDDVLALIAEREWRALADAARDPAPGPARDVRRRAPYRIIDTLRKASARGDL